MSTTTSDRRTNDPETRISHLTGSTSGGLNGQTYLTPITVRDDNAIDRRSHCLNFVDDRFGCNDVPHGTEQ